MSIDKKQSPKDFYDSLSGNSMLSVWLVDDSYMCVYIYIYIYISGDSVARAFQGQFKELFSQVYFEAVKILSEKVIWHRL